MQPVPYPDCLSPDAGRRCRLGRDKEIWMRTDFETIAVSRHGDHILLVTLNRPEESNALNTRMGLDLMEGFEALSADLQGLRGVIINGSGAKGFCARSELKERKGRTGGSWQAQ